MRLKAFKSDTQPETKRTSFSIFDGSGSPEGSQTANPGDVYLRTDTGQIWVKATGTGNTGWKQAGGSDSLVGQYSIANNQTTPQNVTGLVFDELDDTFVRLTGRILRTTSTTNLVESVTIVAGWDGSTWKLSYAGLMDDAGVEFTITSGGQVQYESSNVSGASYAGNLEILAVERLAA